jgi:sugar (pentulose or hexulose) kinase
MSWPLTTAAGADKACEVIGSGCQSDHVMQITADVFGMTAQRPHTFETSGLGAAINAAVGAGRYPDHATTIYRMTRTGRPFQPDKSNHQLYNQLYSQVYQPMYGTLSPFYSAIRSITGYPE